MLFLFYPTIVGALSDSINCISIEGEQRLFKDMEQICWQGEHLLIFYFVSIPGLVVWALGIPFYALYKLHDNRKILAEMLQTSQGHEGNMHKELNRRFNVRLGFLKAGYNDKYYYWEVVLLMRKTVIVMMVTFLAPVSSGVQSLTAICVLIMFYAAQTKKNPYYDPSLNRMETISLFVLIMTIYSGLYY